MTRLVGGPKQEPDVKQENTNRRDGRNDDRQDDRRQQQNRHSGGNAQQPNRNSGGNPQHQRGNSGGNPQHQRGNSGGNAQQQNRSSGGNSQQQNRNSGGNAQQQNRNSGGNAQQQNRNSGGNAQQQNRNSGGNAQQQNRNSGGNAQQQNRNSGGSAEQQNRNSGGNAQHFNQNRNSGGNTQHYNQNQKKDFVKERLESMSGPSINLQPKKEMGPKKFTGRCRLFVGNLPNNFSEEDFKKMFAEFGETAEAFLHKEKCFGFIKLDTREHAEAARAALDYTLKDGKHLRVRFASHGATVKVKNLCPWVSNELLEAAFSIFGEVERAVVIVDDRCRPVGEGIVEFARKQSAQMALKRCTEGCFLLTSSPRPVIVEPFEQRDEEEGLPEKKLPKNSKEYLKEREMGPRLAEMGTFEYDFSNRWKKLFELEQQKRNCLEREIEEGRQALEQQVGWAIHEHEEKLLRERLRHLEEQTNLLQRERQMQMEEEMRRAEERRQQELLLRQQEEELLGGRLSDRSQMRDDSSMMMQGTAMGLMSGAGNMSSAFGSDHAGSAMSGSYGPDGMIPGSGMSMQSMNYSRNEWDPSSMGSNSPWEPPSSSAMTMGSSGPGSNSQSAPSQMDNMSAYEMQNKRRRY